MTQTRVDRKNYKCIQKLSLLGDVFFFHRCYVFTRIVLMEIFLLGYVLTRFRHLTVKCFFLEF